MVHWQLCLVALQTSLAGNCFKDSMLYLWQVWWNWELTEYQCLLETLNVYVLDFLYI